MTGVQTCALPIYGMKCNFETVLADGSVMKMVQNKLYKSENKFYVLIPVANDDISYNLVIIAEDGNSNSIIDVTSLNRVEGISKDDLAPGIATFDFLQEAVNWKLTIKAPTMNIDGSTSLYDLTRFNVYVSDTGFSDISSASNIGSTIPLNPIFIIPGIHKKYVAVTEIGRAHV